MRRLLLIISLILLPLVFQYAKLPSGIELIPKVWNKINQEGIKYPDIVFAQAILESGNMSSKLFVESHNLFGMKYPTRRPTTAVSKLKSGYAVYSSWEDCVKDYSLYQQYVFRNKHYDRGEYLAFLNRSYCAKNKKYSSQVKTIIKKHQFLINSGYVM